ncbi:AMP-binding protein [Gordonia sp. TBRC 11910]|uniref:AMP-binding protein n=1 Tax=Gordonia asplenii TaxID=2725283 RepID=A0A848L2F8_9ACTN|nr:AMP-binding protein [Gordonia asplenii]NMO03265.1 AMP-binding protein [Gordonia asplenii]
MTLCDDRRDTSAELLNDFIDRWVAETPDATAIDYQDRVWSWRQWRERIDRLAGYLTGIGVTAGDRVAVLDKNHPACLDLVFATAALGAATVVLNWRLAPDELDYALTDSGATVLFVGAEFHPAAIERSSVRHLISIDDDPTGDYDTLLHATAPATATPVVDPEAAALIIYSSGTTGRPKGVVLSQRALVAHTRNVGTRFPFTPGDANLVAMPFFHVGGVCYAFFGIRAGVRSILLRTRDATALTHALTTGATHAFLVPPVIKGLLTAEPTTRAAVGNLKILGYGASPTPLGLLRDALAAWPTVGFVQVYGQTELSGVIATLNPDDHRDPHRPHLLTAAGTPVPDAEVKIIDITTGAEVPTGTQGELCFRSPQTMTGYLNRPHDTADTLTDGWIHTGDIGHLDHDGYLYCDDRLKDMIITGGENVYSPEVERVLLDHPAITDAAVIGIPHPHWVETVAAIVVLAHPTTETDIITHCRRHLAPYKCPRTVTFTTHLPRNSSGKLLKKDLRTTLLNNIDA